MCECGVPGWALKLGSTSYPCHGRCGDLSLQGEVPTAEPGIEPGSSCLVVRSFDHQATRLVNIKNIVVDKNIKVCGHCLLNFLRHVFLLTAYKRSL
jgi:hypothetical protein